MRKLLMLLLFIWCSAGWAGTISDGIVLTDHNNKTYDFDAILGSGRSIVVHSTSAT